MARDLKEILRHIPYQDWIARMPKQERFVLSVDVGTSALKWVVLEKRPKGPLFVAGGIDDPANLRAILGREAHSKPCRVHLAISGQQVLLKRVLLPKMPMGEVMTALRWQLKDEIPFPIQEIYLNYQLIRSFEKEGKPLLDLLVGIAHKNLVDTLVNLSASEPPIEIDTIVPAMTSMAHLLPSEKKGCVLIDLGATSTHIGIFHEGTLEMAREIPIGGEELTRALTCEIMVGEKKLSLEKEEAEKVKCTYGISQEASPAPTELEIPKEKLWVLMRPVLERLLGELKRFFQFYEKSASGREIQEIRVTGGGAGLQGLGELLERHLGIAPQPLSFVEKFNFSESFFQDRSREEMERRLAGAVATASPRRGPINFLPPRIIASRKSVFRMQLVVGITVLFLLFASGFPMFLYFQGRAYQKKIQEEKRQWEAVALRRERYVHWIDKKKRAVKMVKIFSTLSQREPSWEKILRGISWIVPKEISLDQLQLEVKQAPTEKRAYSVHFKGEVSGSQQSVEETLTDFLEALEVSPFFQGIKLVSTEGIISPEGGATFEITGRLELD
ncbi:pilus assembly protein PilM [candidate division TA06 bacterium]|nr:pilus assembly protein PilM [candidate division TA06 bacterium]